MKKSYDSKFKSRVAPEAIRGGEVDRGDRRGVQYPPEPGGAMEKEADGGFFGCVCDEGGKATAIR